MSDPSSPQQPAVLSAGERARAFAGFDLPDDERNAALKAPNTGIPRKAIVWAAVAVAVLGLGGAALERLTGNGASGSTPTTTLAGLSSASAQTSPSVAPLNGSLSSFLGLRSVPATPAPGLDGLLTTRHAPFSLASEHGRVVVLTFFNATCTDICPVEAREISAANTLLGARASNVAFVVVNTDPTSTTVLSAPPAVSQTGLASEPNVAFLNGDLRLLNGIWSAYGIQVTVAHNGTMAHNDVMYFLDPAGKIRQLAIPFANLGATGTSTLAIAQINRYADGIAQTVDTMLNQPS